MQIHMGKHQDQESGKTWAREFMWFPWEVQAVSVLASLNDFSRPCSVQAVLRNLLLALGRCGRPQV